MAEGKFVAYYRVSTDRQGESGLGLLAQKSAVLAFLNGGSWAVLEEFEEAESGKRNDRPQLALALEACKRHKAKLVIAKLDRLSRDAHFLFGLEKAGVDFVAADMPGATKLTVGIMAVIAEHEGQAISERTKVALQAAKDRGTKLGWSMPSRKVEQKIATQRSNQINREKADRFAANVLPIIHEIEGSGGVSTLQGIADALNARGIRTARGGKWYPTTVKNLKQRAID